MEYPEHTPEDELRNVLGQLEIYDAIVTAAHDAHAVLDLLLEADDPDAAHRALRERYGFTEHQAWAVMELQFRRMTSKDRETLGERRRELADQAAALERGSGPRT